MPAISLNNSYSQTFDSLANSGTNVAWIDDATIEGWYSTRAIYNTGTGSSNTGALYSFGSSGSLERALGSVASGGTGTVFYGVRLVNDTTETIASLNISYLGEQWRTGGSSTSNPSVAQTLDFQYQIGASNLTSGTWVDFDLLDFTSPIFGTTSPSALDGNAVNNRTAVSGVLSGLSLAPGAEIWLRWQDINDANNDHGLAIDDVSIAVGEPIAGVTITESGGSTDVNEEGETTDTYTIALNTVPAGAVEIAIASDAQTQISTDGINFFNSVTVTLEDTTPKTITVRAINDTDAEGTPHTSIINHSIANSADLVYSNIVIPNVSANVIDNDVILTPIYQIQGSGDASPLVGNTVSIEAVVTGDFQGSDKLNGFFVQEVVGDGDDSTSDGIFVFAPDSIEVNIGDVVKLTGVISETFNQTQIGNLSGLSIVGSGAIASTTIDLPVMATGDLERYEGMLVTFPETLTVTENFNLGRFGEVLLSAEGRLFNPTNFIDPTDIPAAETENDENNIAAVTDTQTANNLRRIILDDGSNIQNSSIIPFLNSNNTLRVGDTTTNLTGVLGYGFGNYRIQSTVTPIFQETNPRTAAPDPVGGNVKVASFNVLNYFNGDGMGGGFPTARGASSAIEFERQRTKIFAALAAMDADVVGLIEIENDGDGENSAISDLVNGLNEYIGTPTYDYIRDPALGVGTDAIKVALIYKPGTVTPVGEATSSSDPIFDRFPVAQTFSLNANGETFTPIINHFKSKSGTGTGADADQGDGQGAFNAQRTQQAQALLTFIDSVKIASGDRDVLVIGDLNAYGEEDPIDVLRAGGLIDELGRFVSNPYSFVFNGQSGRLDHALTTPNLSAQVTGLTEWHINADEPRILDYNLEFKGLDQSPDLYEPTPYRSSDHDPVIIGLQLANVIAGTADADTLIGTDGDDMINGEEGNDVIFGKGGNDQINGGAGNNDRLFAGEGNDTITDPDGVLGAHGEAGNDIINIIFAPDWDNNGNPNDAPRSDGKITGGYGDDEITVTMNDSRFFINLKGDEPVNPISNRPQDGNDLITLQGLYANAVVDLGGGDDLFNGGVGSDNVSGSAGNDTLIGGDGGDQLAGDRGDDVLTGGAGRDRFVLAAGAGTDLITDFTDGEDSIRLLGNLSFEQLTITQGTDANVNNTLITLTRSNELLAILNGVSVSDISAADFMTA